MLEVLGRNARKQLMRQGPDVPGPVVAVLAAVLVAIAAFYAFTFRVNPDELGVVMRFGKVVRQEPPGLHFRLPNPIDEVRLPKVTRQNIIVIGMRTGAAAADATAGVTSVREESLMLG
jgi:modulator of FtsH protease HflK